MVFSDFFSFLHILINAVWIIYLRIIVFSHRTYNGDLVGLVRVGWYQCIDAWYIGTYQCLKEKEEKEEEAVVEEEEEGR